jgi:hypothetical protein
VIPARTAAALILSLLCSTQALAQTLQFGVKGGINVANVEFDAGGSGAPTFDWRTGLVAGGFVTWRAASWLELQPEVLFSSKGASLEEEGISSRLILDYVEVPVLLRFTGPVSGSTKFYVAGGPYFAARARAKTRTEFGGSTEEIDIKDDIESTDLGVVIAGGLELGAIVFDGRYTLGLSDIDADTSDDLKVKNRCISLTVGFKF